MDYTVETFFKLVLGTTIAVATLAITVGWICREWIRSKITASVRSDYDQQLERLKSELRNTEQRLQAEIRSTEKSIAVLTDAALSLRTQRQSVLYSRRVAAVERLWVVKADYDRGKYVSTLISQLKFEAVAKETARNDAFRKLFEAFDAQSPILKLASEGNRLSIESERPFLSPTLAAAFAAYTLIISTAAIKLKILSSGLSGPELLNDKTINDAAKAVLPHFTAYIDKYGSVAHHYLLDPLEQTLIKESNALLEGGDQDSTQMKQTAEVIRMANEITREAGTTNAAQIPTQFKNLNIPPPTV